ncbi:MAG: globin family protein [Cyanobacteria bacterium J06554_11]
MSLNVELLEQSFELVKPKADDFVASFYNNLFTDYPASQPLFEHSDMAAQQKMLKGALVMVIENLRNPDVLSKSLKGLGARHVKYGALPEHYPLVGNSLLKTLGQYAGEAWTPDLKAAWTDAYGAISELMLEGADYSKEEIALESVSSTASPQEDGGLQVELLEQSFELVKPKADEFVASFYGNLLTDYPEAKPLFAHTSMPKQQQMLKGALVMVIENLRKPDVLSKALGGLGARHVKYGALPEHYPLVGNSLIKTLEQYAGSAWTPQLKDAWVGAYGAITELMLDGADYSKTDIQLEEALSGVTGAAPSDTVSTAASEAVTTLESPEGIGGGTAAGIIGGGAVALALLLLILL